MYKLDFISKDNWIFISSDNSMEEPEEFVEFVKAYQYEIGGEIIAISDETQYRIAKDPLHLVFQWDTLFGITVIISSNTEIISAEKTMKDLCDKLNETKNAN